MPRNVAFRLNREIKMPRNSKIIQKSSETKMERKFYAARNSCLKVKYVES